MLRFSRHATPEICSVLFIFIQGAAQRGPLDSQLSEMGSHRPSPGTKIHKTSIRVAMLGLSSFKLRSVSVPSVSSRRMCSPRPSVVRNDGSFSSQQETQFHARPCNERDRERERERERVWSREHRTVPHPRSAELARVTDGPRSAPFASRPAFYRLRGRRRRRTMESLDDDADRAGDTPIQPSPSRPPSAQPLSSLFLPSRFRCHFSIFGDGGVCILPDSLVYLSTDFAGCCGSGAAPPFFLHGGPLSPSSPSFLPPSSLP